MMAHGFGDCCTGHIQGGSRKPRYDCSPGQTDALPAAKPAYWLLAGPPCPCPFCGPDTPLTHRPSKLTSSLFPQPLTPYSLPSPFMKPHLEQHTCGGAVQRYVSKWRWEATAMPKCTAASAVACRGGTWGWCTSQANSWPSSTVAGLHSSTQSCWWFSTAQHSKARHSTARQGKMCLELGANTSRPIACF